MRHTGASEWVSGRWCRWRPHEGGSRGVGRVDGLSGRWLQDASNRGQSESQGKVAVVHCICGSVCWRELDDEPLSGADAYFDG